MKKYLLSKRVAFILPYLMMVTGVSFAAQPSQITPMGPQSPYNNGAPVTQDQKDMGQQAAYQNQGTYGTQAQEYPQPKSPLLSTKDQFNQRRELARQQSAEAKNLGDLVVPPTIIDSLKGEAVSGKELFSKTVQDLVPQNNTDYQKYGMGQYAVVEDADTESTGNNQLYGAQQQYASGQSSAQSTEFDEGNISASLYGEDPYVGGNGNGFEEQYQEEDPSLPGLVVQLRDQEEAIEEAHNGSYSVAGVPQAVSPDGISLPTDSLESQGDISGVGKVGSTDNVVPSFAPPPPPPTPPTREKMNEATRNLHGMPQRESISQIPRSPQPQISKQAGPSYFGYVPVEAIAERKNSLGPRGARQNPQSIVQPSRPVPSRGSVPESQPYDMGGGMLTPQSVRVPVPPLPSRSSEMIPDAESFAPPPPPPVAVPPAPTPPPPLVGSSGASLSASQSGGITQEGLNAVTLRSSRDGAPLAPIPTSSDNLLLNDDNEVLKKAILNRGTSMNPDGDEEWD